VNGDAAALHPWTRISDSHAVGRIAIRPFIDE